jgi:hypothetical protein
LPLPSPVKHRQANNPSFEALAQLKFFIGENTTLLGNLKIKDDMEGHMKVEFGIGGESPAPFTKFEPQILELMEEHMARLRVRHHLGPSFIHHLVKPRHLQPKVLKLERAWPCGIVGAGQKQRVMV